MSKVGNVEVKVNTREVEVTCLLHVYNKGFSNQLTPLYCVCM